MNTFKRILLVLMLTLVAACSSTAEKRHAQLVQDTNDRIERMRKAEADADASLAKALEAAAPANGALVAAVTSNVLMARALRGSGGAGQAFVVPERPRTWAEEARAWVGAVAPFLLMGYQANRTAAVAIENSRGETTRYIAGEQYRAATIDSIANMAIGLKPTAPNVTTNNIGRDGVIGGGTQNNDNSTTTCTAGHGAAGGNGGAGGSGGAGATSPGATGSAGASGGAGGDACR